jgi:hypothetical protein
MVYLSSNEGRVEQICSDFSVVGAECHVLHFGAGDPLNVGQLLQVEGGVLGAVLVDVEQDRSRRRLKIMCFRFVDSRFHVFLVV